MYEKHFGLTSKPFASSAEGTRVFVGPEQAKAIGNLQKGLAASDAVITVTGPVGVGKSTILNRALETLSPGRVAARIGRMMLEPSEVVDLLMTGFGIEMKQRGSIRRFAAFRRMLHKQAKKGVPVAIVIEDTHRVGIDALAEVEALTAADTGDAASANIILMGPPDVNELISYPELARLKQRVRRRQSIESLSPAEVLGYLKHSIRECGGSYELIFDDDVAPIVSACSEGIPRMINTLCEAALAAAVDDHSARVTARLMAHVAVDAFGFEWTPTTVTEVTGEPESETAAIVDNIDDASREPVAETTATPAPVSEADERDIGHDIVVESGKYPVEAESIVEREVSHIDSVAGSDEAQDIGNGEDVDKATVSADAEETEIPELINDTQPELRVLAEPTSDESSLSHLDASNDESVSPEPKMVAAAQTEPSPPIETVTDTPPLPDIPAPETNESEASVDEAVPENAPADVVDELPTLSDSMRVAAPLEIEVEENADAVAEVELSLVSTGQVAVASMAEVKAEPVAAKTLTGLKTAEPTELEIFEDVETTFEPTVGEQQSEDRETSDIDALEVALDAAKQEAPDELPSIGASSATATEGEANDLLSSSSESDSTTASSIPEITLDDALPDGPANSEQLDVVAKEIGTANSLEDISDVMAETLFGCAEFDEAAAAVTRTPPENTEVAVESSPVKLDPVELSLEAEKAVQDDDIATEEPVAQPSPAPAAPKPVTAKPIAPPASTPGDIPLNESVAMRIDILNKMKNNVANMASENVELGESDPTPSASLLDDQPEPIEEQINTSITQTLKALKINTVEEVVEEEKAEEKPEKKSGGLFSRFRKSS